MPDNQPTTSGGAATPEPTKPASEAGAPPITIVNPTTDQPATPVAPANGPDNLETTTAKDGELAVNQAATTEAKAASPEVVKPTAAEAPVLVTDTDVANQTKSAEAEPGNTDDLSGQIEVLSGEIQALEAKIDRMTGNVTSVSSTGPTPMAEKIKPMDTTPTPSTPTKIPTTMNPAPELPPISQPTAPAANPVPVPIATSSAAKADSGKPVTDIYARVAAQEKEAEKESEKKINASDQYQEAKPSVIGTIGMVLTVIGLILFVLLLLSPLYKEMVGETIWNMIKSVGWLTTIGTLGIGLVLSIFGPGRTVLKVLAIICLLLLAVLYLGVNGYDTYFGPLQPSLHSIFTFYQ